MAHNNIKLYVWILIAGIQLVRRVNNINRQTSGTRSAIGAVVRRSIVLLTADKRVMFSKKKKKM